MFSHRRPPEYAARGVSVGLFFAFTPLVGIQIFLLLAFWSLVKAIAPRYTFNVLLSMAWVWLTNVFTIGPVYYVFVLTGQWMLGRWNEPIGYSAFTDRLSALLSVHPDASWLEGVWYGTISLLDAFGLPLFLGCLPWAIGFAWVGYYWALRFVKRRHTRREERRMLARRNRRTAEDQVAAIPAAAPAASPTGAGD